MEFLEFELNQRRFLLELDKNPRIYEYQYYKNQITPLPLTSNYVLGVTILDNRLSLVVDLLDFYGYKSSNKLDDILVLLEFQEYLICLKLPLGVRRTLKLYQPPSEKKTGLPFVLELIEELPYTVFYLSAVISVLYKELEAETQKIFKEINWKGLTEVSPNSQRQLISGVSKFHLKSDEVKDKFLRLRFLNGDILLPEYEVFRVMSPDDLHKVELNFRESLIKSVAEFDLINLPILNIEDIIGLSTSKTPQKLVIVGRDVRKFGIEVEDVSEALSIEKFIETSSEISDTNNLPYSNIFIDKYQTPIFVLNSEYLRKVLLSKKLLTASVSNWMKFLRRSPKAVDENVDFKTQPFIKLTTGKTNVIFREEQIKEIRFNPVFKSIDNQLGVSLYGGSMLPSVDLQRYLNIDSTHMGIFSVIIQTDNQLIEFRGDSVDRFEAPLSLSSLVNKETASYWFSDILYTGSEFVVIPNLSHFVSLIDLNKKQIKIVYESLKESHSIEIHQQEIFEFDWFKIWKEDVKSFLVVFDQNLPTLAIDVTQIQEIKGEGTEVVENLIDTDGQPIYVYSVSNKVYKIIDSSRLVVAEESNIQVENNFSFLQIRDNKIPIKLIK